MLSTSTATHFEVALAWTQVHDPVRARRLAALLFAPSTGNESGGEQ